MFAMRSHFKQRRTGLYFPKKPLKNMLNSISANATFFKARRNRTRAKLVLLLTRKGPLRGHILAPPEVLRALRLPGVNPGVNLRSQGVIPRRFKRKKNCDGQTNGRTHETWTDRRVGQNSYLDGKGKEE